VNPEKGGEGIRKQILKAVPELLDKADVGRGSLRGVGIGFGGPTDDSTQSVIKSHQIKGWDNFPLAGWMSQALELPVALCNDADVAGLAEALFGAGKGYSPVFYITVGTGVGGGLIIDGQIYRGVGRGAAEIGHLRVPQPGSTGYPVFVSLEVIASGEGIGNRANQEEKKHGPLVTMRKHCPVGPLTAKAVAAAAGEGDVLAIGILEGALQALAEGICSVIALLCPKRIVIGGGVSLMGDDLFFQPLRRFVSERVFAPFVGLTEIVPASLGEEMVVHGSLALARQRFGG
jgi:glucokinase